MNIMLANIYERMQEIGTRRALGATKKDILKQFLMESVALTSIGGCLGALVGIGLAQSIEYYSGRYSHRSPGHTFSLGRGKCWLSGSYQRHFLCMMN